MNNYQDALHALHEFGYDSFLPLQKSAFGNPALYDGESNIFVSGDTSSGKTLIPLLHYVLERQKEPEYKMLFMVPYRALAAQKQMEIAEILRHAFPTLKVALSTGECREDDMAIQKGEVDVAVIIYEKAYHFSCIDKGFLNQYQTLVYDEFALVENDSRGVTCDLMLLRGQKAHCRLFVLATPHYSWGQYIHDGKFILIRQETQESIVLREEIPLFLDRLSKKGKTRALHDFEGNVQTLEGIRSEGTKYDFIGDICVKHLRMNQRIFVFTNNCQEVRKMAKALAKRLQEENPELLNPVEDNPDKWFQYVLEETGLLEEDLIDLMSPPECLAFARGITYHNSWLGYELRSMIERGALTDEGKLKVVFCTETMAYGINSSVDVVIVADMHKSTFEWVYTPQKRDDGKIRITGKSIKKRQFLSVNEYKNYIGRAGRYGRTEMGYAYALMTDNPGSNAARKKWEKLKQQRANPPVAVSTLFQLDAYCNRTGECPYFPTECPNCGLNANEFAMPVLSLISPEGVTRESVIHQMMSLSGFSKNRELVERNVDAALSRLEQRTRPDRRSHGWVKKQADSDSGTCQYHLTMAGQIMSGFVVTMHEAFVMTQYLLGKQSYMPEKRSYTPEELNRLLERYPFDLFFQLCYLPELRKIAFDFFEIPDSTNESGIRMRNDYQKLCTKRINSYRKNEISTELYNILIYPRTQEYNFEGGPANLYRTLLAIMVYEWYRTASVNKLNNELNAAADIVVITPGRISRMTQQVSFYLQMTQALCQTLSNLAYKDIAQILGRMEMCLYFGIRESDARVIDVTQLRQLTRQQQLKVAQIMDFCSTHTAPDSFESLTRREKSNWRNIIKSLDALPNDSQIPQQLIAQNPVLVTARNFFGI